MSEVAESARVRIMLADYGTLDSSGKFTLVGAGITIAGTARPGVAAPFAVVATADFDSKFVGRRPLVELSLEDANGDLVAIPGIEGQLGQSQYLRMRHEDQLEHPKVDWGYVPDGAVRPRATIMLMFNAGLPLAPGQRFTWRIRIDGMTRDDWTEDIYVPASKIG
ncbi:hypothetical protein ACJH6H_18220 [Mycobacterium sp. SMC-21]|uniref:hypothetical protein n=1 Tax=Mycobacterium sp. SMC-21 TaxID=3381632 RepID=UPI00387682FE